MLLPAGSIRLYFLPLIFSVACCSLTSCGPSLPPNLSGTLTLDGKPLPDEHLSIRSTATGISVYAHTNKDALYMVALSDQIGIEPGTYDIAVDVPEEGVEETTPSKIPEKYRDFKTSGLKVTVGKKSQKMDIDLKSK